MAERGAVPRVPAVRRRALALARSFTSPLAPDDYLELINPLWSTRELRGRVERIERQTAQAVTVLIKPGWEWPGHQPGQYVRLGIEVDGKHHWRAYSLTSDPGRPDGLHRHHPQARPRRRRLPAPVHPAGARRRCCASAASKAPSSLPDPLPERLLFISAGSGVTPIASMLRQPRQDRASCPTCVHVHCARARR